MEISKTNFLDRKIMLVYKSILYDDHTLAVCHIAALTAWDRTGGIGKTIESFTIKL